MRKILLLISFLPLLCFGQRANFMASQANDDYDAFTNIISAGSVTSTVGRDAVIILSKDFKVYGVWSILRAVWPVVGGTSTAHAQDLLNTFDLTFNNGSGGWTHDANGMQGSGTAYAATGANPRTIWSDNLGGLGIYIRTNSNGTLADMGACNLESATEQTAIWARFGDTYYGIPNCTSGLPSVANTDSRGWFFVSRTAASGANSMYVQKNSTQTLKTEASTTPNFEIVINGRNNAGTVQYQTSRQYAGAMLTNAASQAQGAIIFTIWDRYQTALSRNN